MSGSEALILIARTPPFDPHFYDVILDWIRRQHPNLGPLIDVCGYPFEIPASAKYRVFVPWIQDPADLIDLRYYNAALQMVEECRRRGIAVVNPVDRHQNVAKSRTSELLARAGIKTPRVRKVSSADDLSCFGYPAVLREDRWHQGDFVLLEPGSSPDLAAFDEPVVAEFIDVRSPDGLYRKFRCIVAGDSVVSQHLQISEGWVTHGKDRVHSAQTRDEELIYLNSPDLFADEMLRVREAVDLDFLAIDYGIDREGRPVIWEANPFPDIHFSKFTLVYRNFAMERTIATMVRHWLRLAEIEVPPKLEATASHEA